MEHKPFQVATTTDKDLPLRKWDHKGTYWDMSAKSVAYKFGQGEIIEESIKDNGLVFKFSNGEFVRVGR